MSDKLDAIKRMQRISEDAGIYDKFIPAEEEEILPGDIVKLTQFGLEWFKGKKWATPEARAIVVGIGEKLIHVNRVDSQFRFSGTYVRVFWELAVKSDD